MKFNGTIIGIGILAGLASALMSAGVIAQTGAMAGVAMVLYFLTPLPIFVVALGWGSSAGIVAAAAATIAMGAAASPMVALLMALTSFIPAATGAYLSGLARPAEELGGPKGILVWYPLSDIVFRLALMVAISFVIIGAILGFGPDMARELANTIIDRVAEADPQFTAGDDIRDNVTALLMIALPAIQPAMCLAVLVGNLYLAQRLISISGRVRRPVTTGPRRFVCRAPPSSSSLSLWRRLSCPAASVWSRPSLQVCSAPALRWRASPSCISARAARCGAR